MEEPSIDLLNCFADATNCMRSMNIESDVKIQHLNGASSCSWAITIVDKCFVICNIPLHEVNDTCCLTGILSQLNGMGLTFSITCPIRTLTNELIVAFNNCYYWAYPYIKGDSLSPLTPEGFRSIGAAIAEIHMLSGLMQLDEVAQRPPLLESTWLVEFASDHNHLILDKLPPSYHCKFQDLIDRVRRGIEHGSRSLQKSLIHGDLNRTNILMNGDQLVGIIDFRQFSCDAPIVDILRILRTHHLARCDKSINELNFFALLSGYMSKRCLTNEEFQALDDLVAIDALDCILWDIHSTIHNNTSKIFDESDAYNALLYANVPWSQYFSLLQSSPNE